MFISQAMHYHCQKKEKYRKNYDQKHSRCVCVTENACICVSMSVFELNRTVSYDKFFLVGGGYSQVIPRGHWSYLLHTILSLTVRISWFSAHLLQYTAAQTKWYWVQQGNPVTCGSVWEAWKCQRPYLWSSTSKACAPLFLTLCILVMFVIDLGPNWQYPGFLLSLCWGFTPSSSWDHMRYWGYNPGCLYAK